MASTTSTTSTNSSQHSGAAQGLVDRVRETASAQLSTQKDRATDGLGGLARAIRQSTQSLRDNQQETVAQYVEQAADRIDGLSTTLRDRDLTQLVADAEQFARRQPAVFIGASFVLGVLTARFLKSSGGAGRDWRTGPRASFGRGAAAGFSGSDMTAAPGTARAGSDLAGAHDAAPYTGGGL